jgi:nucleoside-diphosphate-sugar epimerase
MSGVLVTVGTGQVGSRVILRLLAAVREARSMAGGSTRAAEVRTMANTRDVQPGARVSSIALDRNHDAGMVDAVAGCEFLDDRLRLPG